MVADDDDPENADFYLRMGSIAAQYIPDCILSDRTNKNDGLGDNNFLFNQLGCNDVLDDDLSLDCDSQKTDNKISTFMDLPQDGYMRLTNELDKFAESIDNQTQEVEEQNEEAEAAGKMLNYLISIESLYLPDADYFDRMQQDISAMMRAILMDWMMEV